MGMSIPSCVRTSSCNKHTNAFTDHRHTRKETASPGSGKCGSAGDGADASESPKKRSNVQASANLVLVLPGDIHDEDGTTGAWESEPGEYCLGEEAVQKPQCEPTDPCLMKPTGDAGSEDIARSPTFDPADDVGEYHGDPGKAVMVGECSGFAKALDKYFYSLALSSNSPRCFWHWI